ncbi:MAG TPA: class I SAM-dependent methyltransferase [Candidatus Saccharimonadales bacterium]|nr:class I SAM-dependent methyltransferase [Candidatus Saccharimonadales bacterium]
MSEQSVIYELAPTTPRSADMLAKKHGFESVAQLTDSLPANARVLDVGSGASNFGSEVASLRPDISWTNFDYSYNDPDILEHASKHAPGNVQYIPGDATKLQEAYGAETFDAVFSYWMIPHLSIDHTAPAIEAVKAMFSVTKTGGILSIGPISNKGRMPSIRSGKAHRIVKDESTDGQAFAEGVVSETKLNKTGRYTQKAANEVITPLLGTSRWSERAHIPRIYHPETGQYVSALSPKGIRTSGKIAVALTTHIVNQRKAKNKS